ncbi:DNA-binding protein SMUBP-2-like [Brevipalpus obovatus]|uniref:DNA-binding protein SMUBP-2-like n=1 Tax=Brevipalpus obovatus TaxID=246614 RepID=UPI003D9F80BA
MVRKKKPTFIANPQPKQPVVQDREEFVNVKEELIAIEKVLAHERWLDDKGTVYEVRIDSKTSYHEYASLVRFRKKGFNFHEGKLSVGDDVMIYGQLPHLATKVPEPKILSGLVCPNEPKFNQEEERQAEVTAFGSILELRGNSICIVVPVYQSSSLDARLIYLIEKTEDSVSYPRMIETMRRLRTPSDKKSKCDLDRILFNESPLPKVKEPEVIDFVNKKLDDSQREAVQFALAQEKICFIVGPPGTGKTTTIHEISHQLRRKKQKVLICSQSNVALDNIMLRLNSENFIGMVRLGNPIRTNEKLLLHSLVIIAQERFQCNSVCPRKNPEESEHDFKMRKLRAAKVVRRILAENSFVFSTLISAHKDGPLEFMLETGARFDVAIIDECSQALEAACWIPMLMAKKIIIVGDPHQLPPVVMSRVKKTIEMMEVSLMERLYKAPFFQKFTVMLTTQYRMNEDIMWWSSKTFYNNKLTAHMSVAKADLGQLSGKLEGYPPLLLIDTVNSKSFEIRPKGDFSCYNPYEASIVHRYVVWLINNGIPAKSIGVIAPYKLQVKQIKNLLYKQRDVEIMTVDGFQGREKEVIVLSLVRSNPQGNLGFLQNLKRMNVALTRAKKHLAVVCDSSTIRRRKHLASLIFYLQRNAGIMYSDYFNRAFYWNRSGQLIGPFIEEKKKSQKIL